MKKIRQFRELLAFYIHNANYFDKIIFFVHSRQKDLSPLPDQ